MKKLYLLGCFLFLTWLATGVSFLAGDTHMPAIGKAQAHKFMTKVSMTHNREALTASFDSLDVVGRPEQTGKDNPRKRPVTPEHFKRTLTPNANGCVSCHYLPYAKGVSEAPGGNG